MDISSAISNRVQADIQRDIDNHQRRYELMNTILAHVLAHFEEQLQTGKFYLDRETGSIVLSAPTNLYDVSLADFQVLLQIQLSQKIPPDYTIHAINLVSNDERNSDCPQVFSTACCIFAGCAGFWCWPLALSALCINTAKCCSEDVSQPYIARVVLKPRLQAPSAPKEEDPVNPFTSK